MRPITLLLVGAGGRGRGYASFALQHPERARVVAVAEPRGFHRNRIVREHSITPANVFSDWREVAMRERFADAAVICTQDSMHEEPAVTFARLGYHVLLEKPMAPTPEACQRIVEAVRRTGVIFAVCHVLRYTRYTRTLRKLLDGGTIGEIVNVQHMEPVGFWHQAHSFVRGNWRNEAESSFMLLAKSCHDIDWLRYIVGQPCRRVSSFGSLFHFRRENQPAGAADRCLDCAVESNCPYSAKRFYFDRLNSGQKGWPLDVVTPEMTEESLLDALATGPYGRCVYACDNDVVDHQVVNLEYANGATASFTMSAFTPVRGRLTRIGGTRGYIESRGSAIKVFDYLTENWRTIDTKAPDAGISGGHGGGDGSIMDAFTRAVSTGDRSHILSGVFAAEEARRMGCIVDVAAFAERRSRTGVPQR